MQIELKNLSYTYNPKTALEFKALKNVSAYLKQGEFIGIIGPTGSGKTTFIQHLNCLLKPTKGTMILTNLNNWATYQKRQKQILEGKLGTKIHNAKSPEMAAHYQSILDTKLLEQKNSFRKIDKKLKEFPEAKILRKSRKIGVSPVRTISAKSSKKKIKHILQIRSKIGVVFQFAEYQLFEETVEKDIMFGPLNLGIPRLAAFKLAKENLELVGLPESYLKKSPFELSGGEKRRVAIAGVLAMEPDFLIFDEPTAGLDPMGSKEILAIFKKLHKLGKTIVIVTHDLDDILSITDKTMFFRDGKLIKYGETYDILKDVSFLRANGMQPPKLLAFTSLLEEKGMKIGKVTTMDQLVSHLSYKKIKTSKKDEVIKKAKLVQKILTKTAKPVSKVAADKKTTQVNRGKWWRIFSRKKNK